MVHIIPPSTLYTHPLPTGNTILDAVVTLLRTTSVTQVQEICDHLGVSRRDLAAIWHLLTGSTLQDTIRYWRKRQALDRLKAAGYEWQSDAKRCDIPLSLLQDVAHECGWRTDKTLKHALRR